MSNDKTVLTSGPVSPLAPQGGFPQLPKISGIAFATTAAGIKYPGRPDVMLARIAPGSVIAGVFTKSATRSASVLDCQEKLPGDSTAGAAILVNSGNANAFTGNAGQASVTKLAASIAAELNIEPARVFTSSTGVIGKVLPHAKIIAKIKTLSAALSSNSIHKAADAIMTTDTFPKGSGATIDTKDGQITIAGIAKGSGMIAPDMATMLVYIFTDAKISQVNLQDLVTQISAQTFNCITVDSDTSTSDTLLMAATGQSTAAEVSPAAPDEYAKFSNALHGVMLDLAHQVVKDGEGATKFVEVKITGATTDVDARRVASAIANSPLVKTAISGEDPNWGRIVMAVGKSGARADRDLLTIRFGDLLVAENGWVAPGYREADGAEYMKNDALLIAVDMGIGAGRATMWTCDLTHGYISINADYRS